MTLKVPMHADAQHAHHTYSIDALDAGAAPAQTALHAQTMPAEQATYH